MFNILQNAGAKVRLLFYSAKYFYYFCKIKFIAMKRYIIHLGIFLICLGVIILAVSFFAKPTAHNWIDFLALLFIIGGGVFHFYLVKRESRY